MTKEFIYTESFEFKPISGKFKNTLNIIKVWTKRFCRDFDLIHLELNEDQLTFTSTSMEAYVDFIQLVGSIKENGFPRYLSD